MRKLIHTDKEAFIEYLLSIRDSIEEFLEDEYDSFGEIEYLELKKIGDSGLGIYIDFNIDCLEEDKSGVDYYGSFEVCFCSISIILCIEEIAINLIELIYGDFNNPLIKIHISHGETVIEFEDSPFIEESAQQAIKVIQNLPKSIDVPIESIQHYYNDMEMVKQQIQEVGSEREKITQTIAQLDATTVELKEKLENIHENTAKVVLQSLKQKKWKGKHFHSDID